MSLEVGTRKMRELRKRAAYDLYVYLRDRDARSAKDLATMKWAILVLEEARETVGDDQWAKICRQAGRREFDLKRLGARHRKRGDEAIGIYPP